MRLEAIARAKAELAAAEAEKEAALAEKQAAIRAARGSGPSLPKFEAPKISLPKFDAPKVSAPSISLPKLSLPSSPTLSPKDPSKVLNQDNPAVKGLVAGAAVGALPAIAIISLRQWLASGRNA